MIRKSKISLVVLVGLCLGGESFAAHAVGTFRSRCFSHAEDTALLAAHEGLGDNWSAIAAAMPGRSVRQCRDRWASYLAPMLSREPFTDEENELIVSKQRELGNRWTKIAESFSDRSATAIHNQFLLLERRNQRAMLHAVHAAAATLPKPQIAPAAEQVARPQYETSTEVDWDAPFGCGENLTTLPLDEDPEAYQPGFWVGNY